MLEMPNNMKPTHTIQIKELLNIADRTIFVEKGEYLFREGEEADRLFLVLSGKVQISKITFDGRELNLRICGGNDICGELTLFTDTPRYLFNAFVIEDSEVAIIQQSVLEKEMFKNGTLAYEFMKWMSDHFRRTMTKFRDLVLHGKKGALYSTLIRMTNSYGVPKEDGILIDLALTNQKLGDFCGTSRESTNKILNDLKRKGIISLHKGKIIIHDLQYLRNEIACENCPVEFCNIE